MAVVEDRIEQEIHVEASADTVFGHFTDPALLRRWMGRDAKVVPQPGGVYRVEFSDTETAVGEFVVVEPPSRLVFTWGWAGNPNLPPGSSTVEVTLTPQAGGTLVRLVHTGLPAPARAEHDDGWALYVSRLARLVAGGDPGPDPNAG